MEALDGSQTEVRLKALEALNNINAPAVVPAYVKALHDANDRVRDGAKDAINRLGAIGIGGLINALQEDNSYVRGIAAQALGKTGSPEVVQPLVNAINDEDAGVRLSVISALTEMKDPSSIPALLAGLQDPDATVRRMAVHAIGLTGDPSMVQNVSALFADPSLEVQLSAADALGNMGIQALTSLLGLLHHPNKNIRVSACESLGKIKDASATPQWRR
jgi:HEAT repeat protein